MKLIRRLLLALIFLTLCTACGGGGGGGEDDSDSNDSGDSGENSSFNYAGNWNIQAVLTDDDCGFRETQGATIDENVSISQSGSAVVAGVEGECGANSVLIGTATENELNVQGHQDFAVCEDGSSAVVDATLNFTKESEAINQAATFAIVATCPEQTCHLVYEGVAVQVNTIPGSCSVNG